MNNKNDAMTDALQHAFEQIDAANAEDPNREADAMGNQHPVEWLYGRRMSAILESFAPEASPALQLAARGQHLRRWQTPRTSYPEGRDGYLTWRKDMGRFHGEQMAAILETCGFDDQTIDRVQFLLQKKKLYSDPETRTLEDVICLVFLTYYLDDFAAKHPREKVIDILQKTWKKMSESGHKAALALTLSDESEKLVQEALGA